MKKKAKRYWSTILFTATAVALLSGCGGDKGSGANGGSAKGGLPELAADRYELDAAKPAWQLDQKTETTELTWYVNADWWNTDWGNDTVTKKIKEDLNLDVQFITGDDTKLNTFFAGGKKPDIITVFDANSSVAQSAANWAWPLNDLADKYDPYFYEVASRDSLNWFKLSDGKTYGYPDYSNGQDVYDSGLLKATTAFTIRKDVYEALGNPEMGTPEQFLAVLTQIKEKYPDLIPFGSNSMTDSTRHSDVKINIWDHNKEKILERAAESFGVEGAREAVDGIAFHWYTGEHFDALAEVRRQYPDKELIFTEGCVEYSRLAADDQVRHAEMYAHDIIGDFNAGMNGFIDWNLILDQQGGPNHVGNYCDAPVMCDVDADTIDVKRSYYYIGHFSRFIRPGAKRILVSKYSPDIEATAFRNEDGGKVLVLLNRSDRDAGFVFSAEGKHSGQMLLGKHSIMTCCWES